ncbi:hypothetical protein NCCP436_04950 [Pseudomonas sp. NCCP-436]|nr:hypothetical protein NCCP436_04950 [Pseudomonas sp. NCCP-436]
MATLATALHYYNYEIVRRFTLTTLFWGILGMGMGVLIAAQSGWPELNFGIPWLSFGRVPPIHTNLLCLAFGGDALFASSIYVLQRTCRVRIPGPLPVPGLAGRGAGHDLQLFAQGPKAAARMKQATGRPCEITTQPVEVCANKAEQHLLA